MILWDLILSYFTAQHGNASFSVFLRNEDPTHLKVNRTSTRYLHFRNPNSRETDRGLSGLRFVYTTTPSHFLRLCVFVPALAEDSLFFTVDPASALSVDGDESVGVRHV